MPDEEYRKLTKADLLRGKETVTSVYFEELGGSLQLRPLTELEWTESTRKLLAAITATGNPDALRKKMGNAKAMQDAVDLKFDLGALTAAEAAQTAYVVSCGLVDPKLTEQEVRQMAPGVADKIAKKIYEMSKVTPEDIARFRTK